MNKPDIKFQVATVGEHKALAYVISVNNGWYTNAHLLSLEQRKMMIKSKALRNLYKHKLTAKFWRYIGAA